MTVYSDDSGGYLRVGEHFEFMNANVKCNYWDSGEGRMNCTFTYPWGLSHTFEVGKDGYDWVIIWSDGSPDELYDGRFDYVDPEYFHKVRFDCTGATYMDGGRAAFTITVELYSLGSSEITTFYVNGHWSPSTGFAGDDNDTGINRDHAFQTLRKGVESVKDGGRLYIQAGDYRTQPGVAAQIPPTHVGTSGIDYVIEGTDWTDEARFLCGEWPEVYLNTFDHEAYGQYAKYWNYNDESFLWTRGWHSQYCTFVSSDKLISDGYGMKILIDDNKEHSTYTGSALILEEGWEVKFCEIERVSDKAWVQILHEGDVMGDFFLGDGDDLIYEHTVKGTKLPIIIVHINAVFRGQETHGIMIEGIVQLSDYYASLS